MRHPAGCDRKVLSASVVLVTLRVGYLVIRKNNMKLVICIISLIFYGAYGKFLGPSNETGMLSDDFGPYNATIDQESLEFTPGQSKLLIFVYLILYKKKLHDIVCDIDIILLIIPKKQNGSSRQQPFIHPPIVYDVE